MTAVTPLQPDQGPSLQQLRLCDADAVPPLASELSHVNDYGHYWQFQVGSHPKAPPLAAVVSRGDGWLCTVVGEGSTPPAQFGALG